VVGNRELSERFLWDLRSTSQELVLENHAEHLKQIAQEHGFGLSIEPYDMNPLNDFDLGAVADVPMCEFWSVGFDTSYSCQEATSIAHVMGRPVVAAEAFTGAPGEDWKLYPGALKNQGDWAFGLGINRLTYHTFAHKPDESRPGMVMGPYGVHWDRGQTWWPMVGAYHRYIARCQHVLRQGQAIADILYLMPEGAPKCLPASPTASEGSVRLPDRSRLQLLMGAQRKTLIRLADVKDGRIVFPSGASYRVLVLPQSPTMTPDLLRKLDALVRAGAILVGAPPVKSPSLVDYPACDRQVARLAEALWGDLPVPEALTTRACGKGRIYWGGLLSQTDPTPSAPGLYPPYAPVAELLDALGEVPDFECPGPVRYTHRRTDGRNIYFVANRSDAVVRTTATFRVARGRPELWDPLHGDIRALPQFTHVGNRTSVPLHLEAYESVFVVFPSEAEAQRDLRDGPNVNFEEFEPVATLEGPWDVGFEAGLGAPERVRFERLQDWRERPEPGVRHYSGVATYRTTFDLPATTHVHQSLWLDLGTVEVLARVRLNGKECGIVWTAPWRVEISEAVRVRGNVLEIEVANLWPNRMIGDAGSTETAITRTTYRPYKATDPLLPSGLIGPVRLMQ